jgi:hypothetical protein
VLGKGHKGTVAVGNLPRRHVGMDLADSVTTEFGSRMSRQA